MVVCKFFLQGYCKFGDYCKFEHQINENYNSYQNQQSTSILRKSNFETAQALKPNVPAVQEKFSNVDTSTLVKSVVNDMTSVEKGGQWLLSCYAPFKEKPEFPGFEDQSFEEVRFGYYEAANNGTVQQYAQQIQFMLQHAVTKIKTLQNPSPDIVNMLKTIYNSPPSSHYGIISSSSNNGIVNTTPPQQASNSNQPSPTIFAQANANLFNNPQQHAPFVPSGGQGSIFSGQVNSNLGVQNIGSIFAVPATTGQPNIQATPFAQQPSVFSAQGSGNFAQLSGTTQNILGAPAPHIPTATTAIFPNSQALASPNLASSAMFATPSNSIGNFNASNQVSSSIFSQPTGFIQNSNSVFKQQNVLLETQAHSANIFRGTQNTFGMSEQQLQPVDESLYSKQENLTEDDIRFFESEDWDITKIPEKPPTYQMCFKAS